jgi:hypothetical protein
MLFDFLKMSKLELFKKNYEIYNYKKLLHIVSGTDLTCCLDPEPVPNPVW